MAEVIYFVEKKLNDSNIAYIASHKLLKMAGVKVSVGDLNGSIEALMLFLFS